MRKLISLRQAVSTTSVPRRYASQWIALSCSPLITRKREKNQDVLMDASYQNRACAVVLLKCPTPVVHILEKVQYHVGARFTCVAEEGYSLCFIVLHYQWWFCAVILSLDTVAKTEPVIFSTFWWECQLLCSANLRLAQVIQTRVSFKHVIKWKRMFIRISDGTSLVFINHISGLLQGFYNIRGAGL